MKQFYERHKTAVWGIIGLIATYLGYRWYANYSANQASANQAANDIAAQNALESALAMQQTPYLMSGTGSLGAPVTQTGGVGLAQVGLPPLSDSGTGLTPSGTPASPPTVSGTPVASTTSSPVASTTSSPVASTTSSPVASTTSSPVASTTSKPASVTAGKGLYGGPGTTPAQAAILQAGFLSNPISDAPGSYSYTLNQAAAEQEPGFNQNEFDATWSVLTNGGTGYNVQAADQLAANPYLDPAVAFEGSNPAAINAEYEAMGKPDPFPSLTSSSGTQQTLSSGAPKQTAIPGALSAVRSSQTVLRNITAITKPSLPNTRPNQIR